jgi:N-acetylmuramoyl-L-alanine amidase
MSTEHIVEQGECLSSIAETYGFADWKTIYNHELNAGFREKRNDPNVLFPGDRLFVPDKTIKNETCETGRIHRFCLARKQTRLRLTVRDIDGDPLAGKKYKLIVAGATYKGVLPDDARLEQPIPADATEGELTVWSDDDYPDYPDTWKLKLGHMDPVESLSGVQARLNNLGYDSGAVDGIDGPRTQAAVKAFQKGRHLEVDGIAGPQTQAALISEYGS